MTLVELIDHWWQGTSSISPTTELYGMSALWWSRTAKITQIITGFFVLIEVIGIEKIKKGGERIAMVLSFREIFSYPNFLKKRLRVLQIDFALFMGTKEEPKYKDEVDYVGKDASRPVVVPNSQYPNPEYSAEKNQTIRKKRVNLQKEKELLGGNSWISWWIYLPGVIAVVFALWFMDAITTDWEVSVHWLFIAFICVLLFFATNLLLLWIIAIVARLPLFILEYALLEPMGYVMKNKHLKKIILLTSFFLLLLASLVDLLLS